MQRSAPLAGRPTVSIKNAQSPSGVIFDGIDTERLPLVAPESRMGGLAIQAGDQKVAIPEKVPLVTYVTRCFEPTEAGRRWPKA